MKTSLRILTVFEIPIELDISFLILILFIYFMVILNVIPLELAVLITLVFVTVVIHELSHSYVAQRYGVDIERIVLLPIGGVAQMGEIPKKPRQEFYIAAVGPLTNMIIALLSYLLFLVAGSYLPLFISAFIFQFAWVNLILGVFNLLPAFPMDGGRVLRSLLAERMDYLRATELSVSIGKIFAIAMAISGILVFGNFFLILIALFIYIGANQEYKATMISSLLGGIKVENIMTSEVKTLSPQVSVEEALEKMFEYKHMGYPVTDGNDLQGIVTFQDLSAVEKGNKSLVVSDVMSKNLITTNPSEEVIIALEKLQKNDLGRLPVVEDDKLVGIISKTDIIKVLNLMRSKN